MKHPAPPTTDKRWRIVEATMRRHGYTANALIESLHSAQECFGYLDEIGLRYVAASLHVPLSKVYGVATFYHFFTLKPPGRHTCVVCMGTACYIKGAAELLKTIEQRYGITEGQTTEDAMLSLLTARCLGSCGLAPVAVIDGEVAGRIERDQLIERIGDWSRS
jgi:bidirectional [NiFe] hydrogenase diaphorase subunit